MSEGLPDLASLQMRAQELLIDFLEADLDLAFTMLQTARIEEDVNPEHGRSAVDKARMALDSIRRFQGRVSDADVWERIQDRANTLEAAIADSLSSLSNAGTP